MNFIRRFIRSLDEMIFPPVCEVCGIALTGRRYTCEACQQELDLLLAQPACPTCASSPGPYMSPDGRCLICRSRRFHFDGTVRVAPYMQPFESLVLQFKFGRREYLDRLLVDYLMAALDQAPWRSEIEAFVPVPTHWFRKATGGFLPVPVITKYLAQRVGIPDILLLQRTRLDPHQIGLSITQRINNVKGSFRVRPGAGIDGACICVVDDVMTSGATLDEIAKTLNRAGAARVYNLILARAGQPEAELPLRENVSAKT